MAKKTIPSFTKVAIKSTTKTKPIPKPMKPMKPMKKGC